LLGKIVVEIVEHESPSKASPFTTKSNAVSVAKECDPFLEFPCHLEEDRREQSGSGMRGELAESEKQTD
jgi:hypothetical protein